MNANLRISPCDAQRLESFLSGEMSDAHEREFILHLNSCENCRNALAEQAAEPEVWREAEILLKPSDFAVVDAGSIRHDQNSLQIQNVLDALRPTDDPERLGRLGSYEVSGVVGAGGMGVVLKAVDQSLDRTVAIKVLAPHLASSGAARKRFAREAKAAAAVLHPNVIAIHSVSNDEALPYLVMPYVRGTSLQKRLDREGPLSFHEILRIGAQIASGLAAAHAQGLVHRDIKPANILLEEGIERVTITDFGLARAVDDATITHSGMIAGTPQYMSPEQARGEAVDTRSDLFSLGSVLYAACTGRPPFRAETSYGVMRRITDDEPRPIREINPDIPQWLGQLISKLMAKQAADRYQSAAEVAELLEACLAHVQQPTVANLPPALQPATGGSRFSFISRGRSGVIAMIAAFGLGLLGLLAWQATEAPDIAGNWSGEEWGQVVLKKTADGEYSGTYSDTFKKSPGTIEVKWSRLERRYKGQWREGQERAGKISLRLVDDEIRGAWTTSEKSQINPGSPELADLTWKRSTGTSATLEAMPDTGIQIKIAAPEKMEIAVADQRGQFDKSPRFVAPARLNLHCGKIYRLHLAKIAGREGAEFYPTVETGPATPRVAEFLAHNSISIEFTEEDFDQALAGKFVTKVVYLPDPEFQELALAGEETLVSTKLEPGKDSITEADRRGSILAVLRLGNKDIALPDGATVRLGGIDTNEAKASRQAAEFVPKEPRLFHFAASVASRIEKLKDRYPHLAKFSAVDHLRKRDGSKSETYLIDYQHGVTPREPTPKPGGKKSGKVTYDPETGIELQLYFFPSEGFVADAYPPIQVGDVSVRVVVKGPAADPIRDEIVSVVKELEPLPEKLWATNEQVAAIEALLKDAPVTTDYLATLFEERPGTKGKYRLREDVVTIPIVPAEKTRLGFIALGKVYYLPASKGFYIQWDDIAASTLHYYGPFYGRRVETLGLTKDPAEKKESSKAPPKNEDDAATADADANSIGLPKGLKFLAPYQQLHGLSLDMTEKQFLAIVESQKLKARSTVADGTTTYSIPTGDGHIVIVMFGKDSDKCTGIQRLRGEAEVPDKASSALEFSEAKELVLSAGSSQFMLDFDSGKTMDMPATTGRPEQKQMDIQTDQVQPYHYPKELIGLGLRGIEVKESDWDATATDVSLALAGDKVEPLKQMDLGPEKHPTYFFKTREGGMGVLQLLEIVDEPKGMRVRYKTVDLKVPATPVKESQPGLEDPMKETPKASAIPKRLRQFSINHRVNAVDCSADGELIAIANSDVTFPLTAEWKPVVEILDSKTGRMVTSLPLATDEERQLLTMAKDLPHFEVGPLVFSPDATVLAVSTGLGQVKLFNARSGELIRSLDDEQARLADKATPQKLKQLPRAMGVVRSLAFSPDGSLLAMAGSSFDDVADHWDRIERGGLGRSSTGPGRLKVWDAKTGELRHNLAGHSHAFGVAFSPEGPWLASAGRWATASSDGNGVLLWDLEKGEIHREILINANGSTHAVVFAPNKKLAAMGSIIFDKENDTRSTALGVAYPLSGITQWQQTIQGAAMPKGFLPDGKTIVVLSDRDSIRLIDAESGQSNYEIKADAGRLWTGLALAPNAGILVIAASSEQPRGSVEIWGVAESGGNEGAK